MIIKSRNGIIKQHIIFICIDPGIIIISFKILKPDMATIIF